MKRLGLVLFLVLSFGAAAPAAAAPLTFTVNSTDDVGTGQCSATHCSLRQAILAANGNPGPDTIAFDLPVQVRFQCTTFPFPLNCTGRQFTNPIQVGGQQLPHITSPVTIDATTQPGFTSAPFVELRGGVGDALFLTSAADGSVIRGLAITSFTGAAVVLHSDNSLIAGNFIGLNPSGAVDANAGGIVTFGSHNRIGGAATTDRNVISGNLSDGVRIGAETTGFTGAGTLVVGNYIGTDVAGTAAVGNTGNGISVVGGGAFNSVTCNPSPADTIIGGTKNGSGNVISGNQLAGIRIDQCVSNTTIGANFIGTNAAGTAAIGNGAEGIIATNASPTLIGRQSQSIPTSINGFPVFITIVVADGNLISGNARDGISLTGGFQNFGNSKVLGNLIGTNAAGTGSLPNGGNGISTSAPQLGVVIGGPNQDANTIAFNLGAGVRSSSRLDTDRFNRMFSNGGLGIDIAATGVSANDFGETDGLPNFPVLNSVTTTPGSVTITGLLRSTAAKAFTLDFYSSTACDTSGNGEGQTYLGAKTVTLPSNSSGVAEQSFSVVFPVPVAAGSAVTATSTTPVTTVGSTVTIGVSSEFSACVTAT
jgi:CSLREA domain-containing protein